MRDLVSDFLLYFADTLDGKEGMPQAHAARLRALEAGLGAVQHVPAARVPVQSLCEAELAGFATRSPLAKALFALMPHLHLTRSEAYLAAPPSPDFGERYGYGVICGLDAGPPALMTDSEIAFGVMLLGSGTHYPRHHHPADEIYHTITGPSDWQTGNSAWSLRGIGETIHHPPWIPHATRARNTPLVVLYVWSGDLETDAVFLPEREAAVPPT